MLARRRDYAINVGEGLRTLLIEEVRLKGRILGLAGERGRGIIYF